MTQYKGILQAQNSNELLNLSWGNLTLLIKGIAGQNFLSLLNFADYVTKIMKPLYISPRLEQTRRDIFFGQVKVSVRVDFYSFIQTPVINDMCSS